MGLKKSNTSEFVEKAKKVEKHKDKKYDYSKVKYINVRTKVIIICPEHGEFEQTPNKHLSGRGCPDCGNISRKTSQMADHKYFVEQAKILHGDRYNYSESKYNGRSGEVNIKCETHGIFTQLAGNHLLGEGCYQCGKESMIEKEKLSTNEFITRSNKSHGNRYDYSEVLYVNGKTKVNIICKVHGKFSQKPNDHMRGQGCPNCARNKSESMAISIMEEIMGCKFEKIKPYFLDGLELDGYNENYKLAIEYNGIQHEQRQKHWHKTEEDFKKQQERDKKKIRLCDENNITLIIVPSKYNCYDRDKMFKFIYSELIRYKFIIEVELSKEN